MPGVLGLGAGLVRPWRRLKVPPETERLVRFEGFPAALEGLETGARPELISLL